MRLLFALPAAIRATLPGYSSTCDDTTGQLHINIPYANPTQAELLSFTAGSCAGSGPSGANHVYAHDEATQTATLSLDINACGLNANLYDTPVLTRSGEYFMATANVTLGVNHEGNDLIFYNSVLGAECGYRQEYTVTFDYHQQIVTVDQTGCQDGPNGECVVPAFEFYNFTLSEYTDDTYATAADETSRQIQANEMIYLRLAALDLPSHKKFAIKRCRFVDDADQTTQLEYPMFTPFQGSCENRHIDLSWNYLSGSHDANIIHRLFLLKAGDQDSYQLVCDVKVCLKNDHSSDCNAWTACVEPTSQHDYVCDDACPADADSCQVNANSEAECNFQCDCANGAGDSHHACSANQCVSCDTGYTLTGSDCALNQCTCSSGIGSSGADCATHGNAHCSSCDAGYTLTGSECLYNVCVCANGEASEGTSCPSNGASHCVSGSCELGYDDLVTSNVCEVSRGTYENELRLTHGRYGYVMFWSTARNSSGEWATVCNDGWNRNADGSVYAGLSSSGVVCQQLFGVAPYAGWGIAGNCAEYTCDNPFNKPATIQPEDDSNKIIFDNFQCWGDESTLYPGCPRYDPTGLYVHNCDRSEDVWVICDNSAVDPAHVVRSAAIGRSSQPEKDEDNYTTD